MNNLQILILFNVFIWIVCAVISWKTKDGDNLAFAFISSLLSGLFYALLHM